ncbi:MAG: phosphoglucosamine mutase [Myxococcota bacterium]|nr:phosphoglucosamine mutase [Myxococcota bacterium]
MTRQLFGTDGIRGVANQFPMTSEVALKLGRALGHHCRDGDHRHRIVVGKDTRLSGYMLEMAFASGACSMGVDILFVGPLPTPAVAFLTQNMRADAGVMISASHNQYADNGIKIFARDGFKLPDSIELELEHLMEDESVHQIRPTQELVGKAYRIDDALGRYVVKLKSSISTEMDFEGIKVVVDCANGAAYKVAPIVLQELGAEVIAIGTTPNGRNINANCGALHTENLRAAVKEHSADVGIALDGDADRLVVVDEKGEDVDGDCLLALAAQDLNEANLLANKTVVTTVMSNLGLERAVANFGGKVIRTQVGDRYVVEKMRQSGHSFGGEQSGHLVFLDWATTGDGMVGALRVLSILRRCGQPLSEIKGVFVPYPQALVNLPVKTKPPLEELSQVQAAIQQAETTLGTDGRVMVRYSGTESKARVLVEGPEKEVVDDLAHKVSRALTSAIG